MLGTARSPITDMNGQETGLKSENLHPSEDLAPRPSFQPPARLAGCVKFVDMFTKH